MKDERYAEFEKDCQNLIGNVTDALFVAWGKGIIRGRQEEKQSLIYPDYDETYKKGYADGVREAIRMAGKEVGE